MSSFEFSSWYFSESFSWISSTGSSRIDSSTTGSSIVDSSTIKKVAVVYKEEKKDSEVNKIRVTKSVEFKGKGAKEKALTYAGKVANTPGQRGNGTVVVKK